MSRPVVPSKRSADTQEAAWVADEDRFVLKQARKKAVIRAKAGRAQPIDLLAVTLAVIDPEKNPVDDELEDADLDLVEPESLFESLRNDELIELEKGVDTYLTLESSRSNRDYWMMMKTISTDRRRLATNGDASARGVSSVSSDLDKLLGPKSIAELEKLEKQINTKLSSNEPIDTDYWEHLLSSLLIYKARAKLRGLSQSIAKARLDGLRDEEAAKASALALRLEGSSLLDNLSGNAKHASGHEGVEALQEASGAFDPDPALRLRPEDKSLDTMSEDDLARSLLTERRGVIRLGYISKRTPGANDRRGDASEPASKRARVDGEAGSVQNSTSLFDREVARGLNDNEEIFTAEEDVVTKNKADWQHQHRPRKPKYFSRVIRGYEWNKYNQTHYDHDNPPPKVIQGYKFNLFYPDLVDKLRAPTYRIERENGRKRGQTFAPAGETDTCLIRFMAGPPYEDIAFRIVDREWDFSAKRERGFKSSFDKGMLLLHVQFKKVYYRK